MPICFDYVNFLDIFEAWYSRDLLVQQVADSIFLM